MAQFSRITYRSCIAISIIFSTAALAQHSTLEPPALVGDFRTGPKSFDTLSTRSALDEYEGNYTLSSDEYVIVKTTPQFAFVKQREDNYDTEFGHRGSNYTWLYSYDGLLHLGMLTGGGRLYDNGTDSVTVRATGRFPDDVGSSIHVVDKSDKHNSLQDYVLSNAGGVQVPPELAPYAPVYQINRDGRRLYLWSSRIRWPLVRFVGDKIDDEVTGVKIGRTQIGLTYAQTRRQIAETEIGQAGRAISRERSAALWGQVLTGVASIAATAAGSRSGVSVPALSVPYAVPALSQGVGTSATQQSSAARRSVPATMNHCVRLESQSEDRHFLVNGCSVEVNVIYCVVNPHPQDSATAMRCGENNIGHSSFKPGMRQSLASRPMGGAAWYACSNFDEQSSVNSQAWIKDERWTGSGLSARCTFDS